MLLAKLRLCDGICFRSKRLSAQIIFLLAGDGCYEDKRGTSSALPPWPPVFNSRQYRKKQPLIKQLCYVGNDLNYVQTEQPSPRHFDHFELFSSKYTCHSVRLWNFAPNWVSGHCGPWRPDHLQRIAWLFTVICIRGKMAEVNPVSLPSGYEYDFVSTVFDEYHCLICQLPLREPVLTRCGHRYCKKCLNEAMRRWGRTC